MKLIVILSLFIATPALAQKPPPPAVPPTAKAAEKTGVELALNPDDAAFLKSAALANLGEIEASKGATTRGSKKDVRTYAVMMTKDHGGATEELKKLADAKKVALPATLPPEKNTDIERLAKEKDFDASYMAMMIADHEAAVALFEKASSDSRDDDVRAFAEKLLPKLQAHLKQAREIKAKLGGH